MFCRLRRTNHERLLLQNKGRQYIRQATFWTTYAEDLRCGSLPFSIESLKNLGVHLANLRCDLWVECTLLYSAGRVVHLRQQNTLWIQNCRTSIHPRRTKNKSYGQRKKPFLKEVHSLPVQTRLGHDFGTRTIWARDSPFYHFFFPLVSDLTKKNVHRNRLSAFFPPHTSYTRKCYAFTRKNEHGLEIYVYGRYCYKFYKDELGLVANV